MEKANLSSPSSASTGKQRLEYTLNKAELIYPGGGHPFATKPPLPGLAGPVPAHPLEPPTEQPRNKVHLEPANAQPVIDLCGQFVAACGRRKEEAGPKGGQAGSGLDLLLAQHSADACALLKQLLADHQVPEVAQLAVDLAMVCAHACESCAVECSRHPESKACTDLVTVGHSCAAACRKMAAG